MPHHLHPLRHRLALFWLAILLMPLAALAQVPVERPLPTDPRVHVGILANGMHYEIRHNQTPPGKVTVWLHIGSGSLNENHQQQGLAHYLEHMAFNGTKHFPGNAMFRRFAAIGLTLGRHQNAYTDFDQTTYSLSLPDARPQTLDLALLALSDIAYRMSLEPKQIDAERGVILSEARSYMGPGERTLYKILPQLLPGSRFSRRLPIGQREDIEHADRTLLKAYYDRWYRPDNSTLLVVGDVDAATMTARIRHYFGDWKARSPRMPDASPGIRPYSDTRAVVVTDPELVNAEVGAVRVRGPRPILTEADYRRSLIDFIGAWIMDRRLNNLIDTGDAPFLSAAVDTSPLSKYATLASITADGRAHDWRAMLERVLAEVKRARQFGFQAQELADAKQALRAWAKDNVDSDATRDNRNIIGDLNAAVSDGSHPMSAEQERAVLDRVLPTVTQAEVEAAFRRNYGDEERLFVVKLPAKNGAAAPSQAQVMAAAATGEATAVTALPPQIQPHSLLTSDPAPGHVANARIDRDLGIYTYTLTNGVRVHIRQMTYRKNQVYVGVTLAGGTPEETAATRGYTAAAARAWTNPATRSRTSSQIRDLFIGKNVGVSGQAVGDGLALNVAGSPADLRDGLRLAYLLLTQPRIEPVAFKRFKERTALWLAQRKFSVEAQLDQRVNALLMNNDPRFLPPTQAQVEHISLAGAQRWLDHVIRTAPIEVSIVGDIDRERALRLALTYFGSLPARPTIDNSAAQVRQVALKPGPYNAMVQVNTITPRASVEVAWRGADWANTKDRRALEMAASILELRLFNELREKRGLVYSVDCRAIPGGIYRGSGQFAVSFTTAPNTAMRAADIAQRVIARFVKEGPTAQEMSTMRHQLAQRLQSEQREPSFWAATLATLDYHQTHLDDLKSAPKTMLAYTAVDLRAALQKYLVPPGQLRVVSAPVEETAKAASAAVTTGTETKP